MKILSLPTTRIPLEITAAILGAAVIPLDLLHLPYWGTMIGMAAAFWMREHPLRRLLPGLFVGTTGGLFVQLLMQGFFSQVAEASLLLTCIVNVILVFAIGYFMLLLGNLPLFQEKSAMFLGVVTFLTTHNSPLGHHLLAYWMSATLMCLLGPPLACLALILTFPYKEQEKRNPERSTMSYRCASHKKVRHSA